MILEKEFCVYLTDYYGDKLPMLYIGSTSTKKIRDGYHGSVGSKKYKEIWKQELKQNPHLFRTTALHFFDTRMEALEFERKIQTKLDVVKNINYINMSFASVNGFFGMGVSGKDNPHYGYRMTETQRKNHSIIMTEIGTRQDVKETRSRVQSIVQNSDDVKLKKSIGQSLAWKNPNSNLKNSAKFENKPISFSNYTFNSVKDCKSYLKSQSISPAILKYIDTTVLSLEELPVIYKMITKINYIGVDFELYPSILDIYNKSKFLVYPTFNINSNKFNRIVKICNMFKDNMNIFNEAKFLNILNKKKKGYK